MATALRQAIILWVSLLILGGLAFFVIQLPGARAWLWRQTGEEALLSQVKGISDLAGDLLRARPQLAASTPIEHANVNPFGVNVFLEQEVDPAKREQAVRMGGRNSRGKISRSTAKAILRTAATSPIAQLGTNMITLWPWPNSTM
jgi:hypothetical protein